MDVGGNPDEVVQAEFAAALATHLPRLRALVQLHLPERVRRRCSVEDILQELGLAGLQRLDHWRAHAAVPPYVRLRSLALQVIADCCRRHLGAAKRDCAREVAVAAGGSGSDCALERWLTASASSPLSRLVAAERLAAVRAMLAQLAPADREILALRHGEDLGNQEVAAVLGIEVKAASIRYVRALQRLRERMGAAGWSTP